MPNKITYGLEQVHIAFETAATPTWATPTAIPGAVRFTPTAQGQETTFYADNGVYYSNTSNNGYTAELEMALVPDSVLAEMLGWKIDDNGMLVEVANATPKKFALLGQVLGDSKNRRFVYYDCQATRPAKEHNTRGETIEPKTDVLSLTIFPIDATIDGETKKIVKGVMELGDTNAAAYNAFFDAVTLPDATPSAVTKTLLAGAIALAGTLTEADYTVATWADLTAKLTAAGTVNDNVSATQAQVNTATAELQDAILALEPVGE